MNMHAITPASLHTCQMGREQGWAEMASLYDIDYDEALAHIPRKLPHSDRLATIHKIAFTWMTTAFFVVLGLVIYIESAGLGMVSSVCSFSITARPFRVVCDHVGDARPAWILVFFLLPDVVYYASAIWCDKAFESHFKALRNPYRWVGYGISSTLMILTLYMLSPIVPVNMLLMSAACNISMIAIGAASDWLTLPAFNTQSRIHQVIFWLGFIPWAAEFAGYYELLQGASNLPAFVWVAAVGLTVLFSLFPIPMWMQQRVQPGATMDDMQSQFMRGEMVFEWLSVAAKTFLAFTVTGGLIRG